MLNNLWFTIAGCFAGFIACQIYLRHMRRCLQKNLCIWKTCLLRLTCVMLFFGAIFYVCAPAGIAALITFIFTRDIMLFKESRGNHGKL